MLFTENENEQYPLLSELVTRFGLVLDIEGIERDRKAKELADNLKKVAEFKIAKAEKKAQAKAKFEELLAKASESAKKSLPVWKEKNIFEEEFIKEHGEVKGRNGLNFWYNHKIINTATFFDSENKENEIVFFGQLENIIKTDSEIAKKALPVWKEKSVFESDFIKAHGEKGKQNLCFWYQYKIINTAKIYKDFRCAEKFEIVFWGDCPF